MSVQSEITRISGNVAAALAAIAEKGVSVPSGSKSDALASLIASIEASVGGAIATGTYTPATSEIATITHGLGVVPSFFCIWLNGTSSRVTNSLINASTRQGNKGVFSLSNSNTSGYTMYQYVEGVAGLTQQKEGSTGSLEYVLWGATAQTIKVGTSKNSTGRLLAPSKEYIWVAGVV